jgi:hypothetical protein
MAWISLLALEDSPSLSTSGSPPWRIVNEIPTAKLSYCSECKKAIYRSLPSGTTYRPYAATCCQRSILSTAASPARISAARALGEAWLGSEADYFSRSCVSLMNLKTRRSFSLKTSQPLGPVEEREWGRNWPYEGMIVGGMLYQLRKSERPTSESDGSSLLPTPSASRYGSGNNGDPGDGRGEYAQKGKPSLWTMALKGLWPTPTAKDGNSAGNRNGPGSKAHPGVSLTDAVRKWPTPNSRDWKGPQTRAEGKEKPAYDDQLPTRVGGQLNPLWVEWLMGYPLGWTVLGDWAMQWFQRKRKKRSRGGSDCD